MRTQITSNPAASIHLKVKLVADHAHAKIAETISVGAYLTGTIISWKLVLARYVSASLIVIQSIIINNLPRIKHPRTQTTVRTDKNDNMQTIYIL